MIRLAGMVRNCCIWLLSIALLDYVLVITPVKADNSITHKDSGNKQFLVETIHILGGFNNRVPRWSGEIRIAVIGILSDSVESSLDKLLAQLSLYSGLVIRRIEHDVSGVTQYFQAISESPAYDLALCSKTNAAECANFVVIVSSQAEMYRIAQSLPMRNVFQRATASARTVYCFFSPGISHSLEIEKSVVFINQSLSEKMKETCLQEEITQSFGLFNDYSGSLFYSFNNTVSPKMLTTHDKVLLSSLYDRAYSPGSLANSIANQVIDYGLANSESVLPR